MSNLSELLPAGAGGKNVKFVASGTLPNGKPVILNANGTVTAVAGSGSAESIPAGSDVVFHAGGTTNYSQIAFDPNTANKFVVSYQDAANSNYGTVIVGTISGTSISFGSEIVFNSDNTNYMSLAFDPNTANKFVITYSDGNSAIGTARVGTVSGTSISFGSEVVFNAGATSYQSLSFHPSTANRFIITYTDDANSGHGTAIVGTVSGTSISFGSEVVFNAGTTYYTQSSFDPSTAKLVAIYRDAGNSSYGTAIVGTVSGTSISFGSEVVYNSAQSNAQSVSFDPNTANKCVIVYQDAGNSSSGTAIVGTVSGTSISFGTAVVFNVGNTMTPYVAFEPNTAGKLLVVYRDQANSAYGAAIAGTVSGTSITFDSEIVFNTAASDEPVFNFDPNTAYKFVLVYRDDGNSSYGTAFVGQVSSLATNLTSTNFLGISDSAISSGATGKATIKGGIKTGLSSLTPNAIYYVQGDGTITTASASPAVRIGKALLSTSINLEYNS